MGDIICDTTERSFIPISKWIFVIDGGKLYRSQSCNWGAPLSKSLRKSSKKKKHSEKWNAFFFDFVKRATIMFLKLIGVFFSLWAPFILVMHQCRQLLLSNITYFQLVIGLLSSAFLAPDHLSNSYQFLRVLPSHDEWLIFLPYLCKKAQYGPLGTEIRAYYNPESVMINGLIFRVTLSCFCELSKNILVLLVSFRSYFGPILKFFEDQFWFWQFQVHS